MNLKTNYLGLTLTNPIVVSSSPLSQSLDGMKKLAEAGASAIVMHSLFEEQIVHEAEELEHYETFGTESFPEAITYFPKATEYRLTPDEYIELLSKAVKQLGIPIIGSLNGITPGGWISYAKKMEDAGASAIEINVYYLPTDTNMSGQEVEERYLSVLSNVRASVKIPVAVKLNPFFSSIPNIALKLVKKGANGLVLFNRFYQPDIDLEKLDVTPDVRLSDSNDSRLPTRWIGILYGKINASLAASSGIHTAEDVIKLILAGADVTMMCSAVLKNGPQHISKVLKDIENWMKTHDSESIEEIKGSLSHKSTADPSAYERANYMKALNRYKPII